MKYSQDTRWFVLATWPATCCLLKICFFLIKDCLYYTRVAKWLSMCRVSYFIQEKPSYLHFPYVLPSVILKQLPADCTGGKERFRFLFLSLCLMWNSVWVWQEHTFIHTVWVGIRIRMWFIGAQCTYKDFDSTLVKLSPYLHKRKETHIKKRA